MPKAKKRARTEREQNISPVIENKSRGRPITKQDTVADRQRSRSVDGVPLGKFRKRIRRASSPSKRTLVNGSGDTIHLAPDSKAFVNGKRVRPAELQELRGYPEPIAIVTAEAFKDMDRDLQSTIRGLFHDLNDVLEPRSTLAKGK
jgi:hypothetical protein